TPPGKDGVIPVGGRLGGKVAIGGCTPPGNVGVIPVGGRLGGRVAIGGRHPPGHGGVGPGRGGVGGPRRARCRNKAASRGGGTGRGRFMIRGNVTFGGIVKPPFWFCVSSRQSPSVVSYSLWVPPLPLETFGDVETCSPRRFKTQVSTV